MNFGIVVLILIILLFTVYNSKYSVKELDTKSLMKCDNFISLFDNIKKRYGDSKALKVRRGKKWMSYTYDDYHGLARSFAGSLQLKGCKAGDKVCIIGYNAPGWIAAHLGSMMVRAVPAGIYLTADKKQCRHIVKNCKPKFLIVENSEQLDKFRGILKSKKCRIKHVVVYSDTVDPKRYKLKRSTLWHWDDFIADSKYDPVDVKDNDCATLIYTSGTTGKPKGVIVTHYNIICLLKMCMKLFGKFKPPQIWIQEGEERFISYLPLNHIAAQVMDIYLPILCAGTVYIADPNAINSTLIKTIKSAKPTIFAGVPRVWEKIEDKIRIEKDNNPNKDLIKHLGHVTTYFNERIIRECGLLSCKYPISTGAPLGRSTKKFFQKIGFPLYEIYGMSETAGPVVASYPTCYKERSVGKALPGVQIFAHEGEICIKSPTNSVGYFKNKTKFVDKNGWLHTGDIGFVDKDGFIYVTGRKKEIIITSGGENIAPTEIEQLIKKKIPIIDHAVVIGDKKKYLTCLFTIKMEINRENEATIMFTEDVVRVLKTIGSKSTTIYEAEDDKKIQKYIDEGMEGVNEEASSKTHTIKKWTLLLHPFTVESGELSSTMKLKREVINKKYKSIIDTMY